MFEYISPSYVLPLFFRESCSAAARFFCPFCFVCMTDWLRENYPAMQRDMTSLSPLQNGVPFSLAFSEVWHYTFGFATKWLAETEFYANPRAKGNRYEGYMPLVWASSVLKGPGR